MPAPRHVRGHDRDTAGDATKSLAFPRGCVSLPAMTSRAHMSALTGFLLVAALFVLSACDSRKNVFDSADANLACLAAADCGTAARGTRFGMIGDSWTDLLLGVPAIRTMSDFLQEDYGYGITRATLGGQTLRVALQTGLHYRVIDTAGPDLKYMLLSLGGNDLSFNAAAFTADPAAERQRVFDEIRANLLQMIRDGNNYKISKWGGGPLLWIIHGYDYSNPDNPFGTLSVEGCRSTFISRGFTDAQVDGDIRATLDLYNTWLAETTALEVNLRYIDLRGTLGGPPISDVGNMFDCIHPTTGGFSLITARYVTSLELLTNNER